jgi:hypothetical protein
VEENLEALTIDICLSLGVLVTVKDTIALSILVS